jgi:alpha-ketoglutarate-dependent 2,4-dichlorophenoxyacetate dioxygenase
MPLATRALHPLFGVEILGVDCARPIAPALFAEIRALFEAHCLLLFRGQALDDDGQIAFSRLFGPLERTLKANPAVGSYFARQSNLDIATGAVIPSEDRRMRYQKANYLWHTDSSFKAVPSLCSLLSARIVPPEGGNTEFATMRAAYDDLPQATKDRLEGLTAEHDMVYSRSTVDPTALTEEMKAELPAVRQVMVRTNPVNGRKAIYVGAHASHVIGWPVAEGRAFIQQLTEFATQPRYRYSHQWRVGDLVVWDNRSLLHRATAYDAVKHQRLMQRTTVAGDGPTAPQIDGPWAAEGAAVR